MTPVLCRRLLLSAPLPILLTAAGGEAGWPENGGYRTQDYRAPTPLTVPGGRMVTTEEARALLGRRDVVWVDMLPAPRRP